MENFNHTLFLWLNAPAHPDTMTLTLAVLLAQYLIWLIPIVIVTSWLRGNETTRKAMLIASMSALAGLVISQIIGLVWPQPRPFVIGLGHTLIHHAANASFPSDHLTLWWAVTFSLVMQPHQRKLGVVLALLGLPIAWSRIYLGVHFPLDMLGAALVAIVGSWLGAVTARWYLLPLYRLASQIQRRLLGRWIDNER